MSDVLEQLDANTRDHVQRALWMESPPASTALIHPANLNPAFGERFRCRIEELMRPLAFAQDETERYQLMMDHAETLSPHQALAMTYLLGGACAEGFAELPVPPRLEFPRDHLPRFGFQQGWHFVVGSCWDTHGQEYGVVMTLHRTSLLPPHLANRFGLTPLENQVMQMQFKLSEAGGRSYHAVPPVLAGTTGLLAASSDPLHVALGRNSFTSVQSGSLFPLRLRAWGQDRGTTPHVEMAMDITLSSTHDMLFQGRDGCLPCCSGLGTLYYSYPGLTLAAGINRLKIGSREIELSAGKFWFDHQQGNMAGNAHSPLLRAAGNLVHAPIAGWDWIEVQLDDGQALTVYARHGKDQKQFVACTDDKPPGVMTVAVRGKHVGRDGAVLDINGTLRVKDWIKGDKTCDPGLYPARTNWYPNRWELEFASGVPPDCRELVLSGIVSGAQTGINAQGSDYAEGAVYVRDPGGRMLGRGFAESVLYADTLETQMRLAGLPVTPHTRRLMKPAKPSLLLKARSLAHVLRPSNSAELKRIWAGCIDGGADLIV